MGSKSSTTPGGGTSTLKGFPFATLTTSSRARKQRAVRRIAKACPGCERFASIGCKRTNLQEEIGGIKFCAGLRNLRSLEFNTLRQWQFVGIVDRAGNATHVGFPRIAARFAAAARFLFAAERAADLGPAGTDIDVRDAAVGTGGRRE